VTVVGTGALVAAANTKALWYLTRGSGLVALLLLTVSLVGGIVTTKRWSSPGWSRFVVEWLHRNVSLLAVVFLGVHIATAITDGFAPIGWLDAVIPFRSPYRPIWLGLGAVAFDLIIAVTITSLLRVRLGYRVWKAVHWTAYACWPIAVVHGLGTGSDTRQPWTLLLTAAAATAVLVTLWWRVWPTRAAWTGIRLTALSASLVAPVLVLFWLAAGPLRPGWSRAAQTAVPLLTRTTIATSAGSPTAAATGGVAGAATAAPTTPPRAVPQSFSAPLTGAATRSEGDDDGMTTIDIRANVNATPPLTLEVILQGMARRSGGVRLEQGTVALASGAGAQYQGPVSSLQGGQIGAVVTDPDGNALALQIQLSVDPQTNQVTGTVRADPASNGSGP